MKKDKLKNNPVNHPSHYTSHPSGIEAIEICGNMGFCLGNAFKYQFRMENKWNPLEDLKKARWYIDRQYFQTFNCLIVFPKQEGLSYKDDWAADFKAFPVTFKGNDRENVIKVVGDAPGNVEKALLYTWIADKALYQGELGDALLKARYYIDHELKKRNKKTKKKVAQAACCCYYLECVRDEQKEAT